MNAKILDYSIKLNSKNKLYIQVLFQTTAENGDLKNYRWFGSFNEGTARNITLASLAKMGLRQPTEGEIGQNENSSQAIMRLLNKGITSKMLDATRDYEIELDTSLNDRGEPRNTVKNIRLPGERPVGSLDDAALAEAIASTTIGDEMLAKAVKHNPIREEEDLPF